MKKKRNYALHLFLGLFLFALITSYPGCYSTEKAKPIIKTSR